MNRLYLSQAGAIGELVTLDKRNSHYLSRVLRARVDDHLILFDGRGHEYQAQIRTLNKQSVQVELLSLRTPATLSPLHIHLGIGISKGSRMDTIMQKSTELGVREITPLLSEHLAYKFSAEHSAKKMEHWQQIIISACEQCGQNTLPLLHSPQPLSDWTASNQAALKLLLQPQSEHSLSAFADDNIQTLSVLIGPEGGFSEREISVAKSHGFSSIHLGPRVLRTETAPLAIMAMAQMLWGDF